MECFSSFLSAQDFMPPQGYYWGNGGAAFQLVNIRSEKLLRTLKRWSSELNSAIFYQLRVFHYVEALHLNLPNWPLKSQNYEK